MGHYAAEMSCNTCGMIRCVCVRHPSRRKWIIDGFKAKPAILIYYGADRKMYDSQEEAEADIPEMIRARIDDLQDEITMLHAMLTMEPQK